MVGSAQRIRSPAKSWVSARYENANLGRMQLTDQVRELLQGAFPSGEVEVSSFSGTDHLSARVRSDRFAGLSLIEQHRLVYAPGPAPDLRRHHPRIADQDGGHMIVTDDQIREEILQTIRGNRVMLFMKGTPDFPRCGFSARTVQCLNESGAEFAAMDILPDPRIRQELSAHSGWPTIPQLFIDGELVGGCDIVSELHESGELRQMVAPAA